MSAHDWRYLPYKVFYFQPESPLQLQAWLERMHNVEELRLIAATGDFYIFEPIEKWNGMPRREPVEVTSNPKCGRCGCEIEPGAVHFCVPAIEDTLEQRVFDRVMRDITMELAEQLR